MTAYAILLRGVNVGGRSVLPMATLRDVLTSLDYADVRTYLQSGNAVLSSADPATQVVEEVKRALADAVGRDIEVMARSAAQLRHVVERWPFDHDGAPTTKHVTFLRDAGDATPLEEFDAADFNPERFAVDGPHVYLSLPDGLGRSALMPVIGRRLNGVVTTTRNWNTVTALADLTAALG